MRYKPATYFVLRDPAGLFVSGTFGRFDFLCSLAGKIWAEGMVVRDPEHRIMEVSYPWVQRDQLKVLVDRANGNRWRLNKNQNSLILMEKSDVT